jgi:hypothetical protein
MIITVEHLEQLPDDPRVDEMIRLQYPHLYSEYKLRQFKNAHRPESKRFEGKLNERDTTSESRRRSRPWDNCWFSNKPHIISLTIEEAISKHPDYMLWCYKNLSIKWSVHTVRLFDKMMIKIN